MTPTEELLRAAAREAAGEIRPDSIGPLDLTAIRRSGSRRLARLASGAAWPPAGSRRRGHGRGRPVGRPAAGPDRKRGADQQGRQRDHVATSARPGRHRVPFEPYPLAERHRPADWRPHGAVDGIPPYSWALTGTAAPYQDHPLALTVRDTVTGQILATAAMPAGYGTFSLVAPGSDNTTFLVGAEPWEPTLVSPPPVGLFLARYDPAAGALTLTRLPVPLVPVNEVEGMAMSPDGRELALAVLRSQAPAPRQGRRVRPARLPAAWRHGAHLVAARPGGSGLGVRQRPEWSDALSWRPDGHTIAFNWISGGPARQFPGWRPSATRHRRAGR